MKSLHTMLTAAKKSEKGPSWLDPLFKVSLHKTKWHTQLPIFSSQFFFQCCAYFANGYVDISNDQIMPAQLWA